MNSYAILITHTIFVKDYEFFKSQGGETQPWGEKWVKVQAKSVEDARRIGFIKKYGATRGASEFKRHCKTFGVAP